MTVPFLTAVPLRRRNGSIRAFTIIDGADWPAVNQYRWCFDGRYAMTKLGGRNIRLHTFLMGEPPEPSLEVDHRNRVKLDNRRSNLRWVTALGNRANMDDQRKRPAASGYRGVFWNRKCRKWQARANRNYRQHHLGLFDRKEDATEAVRRFWADIADQDGRT
jgi:hypothetical protein